MMHNIPVQTDVTAPRSVAVIVAPCPYCGTHEAPEDRDGVISCPNCGYPLTQEIPLIDEWELLIAHELEPLDEACWAHLLTQADGALQGIDALGLEDNRRC
jgi:hypothetical protein